MPLPLDQKWFLDKRKTLGKWREKHGNEVIERGGYKVNDKGACHGVACEGLVAFLARSMPEFEARYNLLADEKLNLAEEVEKAKALRASWSRQASAALQAQYDQKWKRTEAELAATDFKSEDERKKSWSEKNTAHQKEKFDAIQKNIKEQRRKYFADQKDGDNMRRRFKALMQMEVAAQTVSVLQNATRYSFLFEEDVDLQTFSQSFPLVMPKKIKQLGGVAEVALCAGIYTEAELTEYFAELRKAIEVNNAIDSPLGILIGGASHSMTIGFDPKTRSWTLIDANQLPKIEIQGITKDADLAKAVLKGFGCDKTGRVAMGARCLAVETKKEQYQQCLQSWKNSAVMQRLHTVTRDKALQSDRCGESWLTAAMRAKDTAAVEALMACVPDINKVAVLGLAVKLNYLPPVQRLLNEDPDLATKDDKGVTPVYAASQNNCLSILRLLLSTKAKQTVNTGVNGLVSILLAEADGENCKQAFENLIKSRNKNAIPERIPNFTPLHGAVFFGHAAIVAELLNNGADIDAISGNMSVMDMAVVMRRDDIIRMLAFKLLERIVKKLNVIPFDRQSKAEIDAITAVVASKFAANPVNCDYVKVLADFQVKVREVVDNMQQNYRRQHRFYALFDNAPGYDDAQKVLNHPALPRVPTR